MTDDTLHDAPDEIAASASRDRTIRHTSGLDDLMRRRGDLDGVLPMADLIRESLRWTA